MALLELDNNTSHYQIRGYRPGELRINSAIYTRSLILTPHTLLENWPPQTFAELTAAALITPLLQLKPTVLLLGTGEHLHFPTIDIYGELINHGIGVEIMNTSSACRTFSALSSENREVAAALIIL